MNWRYYRTQQQSLERLVRYGPQDATRRRLLHPIWGGHYRNWTTRRQLPKAPSRLLVPCVSPAPTPVPRNLRHVPAAQVRRHKRKRFVQRLRGAAA